jgi:hypothetical protein
VPASPPSIVLYAPSVNLEEVARGLWRWETPHPEWRPNAVPDSPADWPERVGSVAYASDGTLTLIDPLVDRGGWGALDDLARSRRVHALTTIAWHRRSRDAVRDRYGTDVTNAKRSLPPGVESITIANAGERMFWLAEHRALVPGDRILGADGGGLRVCPDSWLRYLRGRVTPEALRRELRKLLDLPVEMVLVSHGTPVLSDGRAALEHAIAST